MSLSLLPTGPYWTHMEALEGCQIRITPHKKQLPLVSEEVAAKVVATDCRPGVYRKVSYSIRPSLRPWPPLSTWQLLLLSWPGLWFLAFAVYWHDSSFKCPESGRGRSGPSADSSQMFRISGHWNRNQTKKNLKRLSSVKWQALAFRCTAIWK